ncbi:MAG: STAS domain-containing protein, partial [Oscillochloris sp.]|nr:STAS domain-containing protein [Oscillochloris sp.]
MNVLVHGHTNRAQFQQLLFWAILATCGCTLAFLGVGLATQALGTIVSAGTIAAYFVILLIARAALLRDQQAQAVWLVSLGLVVVALLLTIAQPTLWVSYAVVPLLAAAVVLQYAPRMPVAMALVACGVATAGIAVIGEIQTPSSMRPALSIIVLRIGSMSTTVAFVLFLLWQFRSRLHMTLDMLQTNSDALAVHNATLAESNIQLEQQMRRSALLLEQVLALETPVTTLAPMILYAPVVGHLTQERADNLRARLFESAHGQRALWLIVDIQGVPAMDTRVAGALSETFNGLRLLGC